MIVRETDLSADGFPPARGKVRDIYDLGETLLLVSTDRISAYDSILPTPIVGKGEALNQISAFWFKKTAGLFPNHFISSDIGDFPPVLRKRAAELTGRSMLVKKTRPLPVECVVRGYLCGSAWAEYLAEGTACGIDLPSGIKLSQKLTTPIFTPATKAPGGGRDVNITFEQSCEIAGGENMERARAMCVEIYKLASGIAADRGIIIADTKFEMGVDPDGRLIFIDEMLTPDSSRFWSARLYQSGKAQDSFDKQFVRDYLDATGWDRNPPAPSLPPEVAEKTSGKYMEMKRVFSD